MTPVISRAKSAPRWTDSQEGVGGGYLFGVHFRFTLGRQECVLLQRRGQDDVRKSAERKNAHEHRGGALRFSVASPGGSMAI